MAEIVEACPSTQFSCCALAMSVMWTFDIRQGLFRRDCSLFAGSTLHGRGRRGRVIYGVRWALGGSWHIGWGVGAFGAPGQEAVVYL